MTEQKPKTSKWEVVMPFDDVQAAAEYIAAMGVLGQYPTLREVKQ